MTRIDIERVATLLRAVAASEAMPRWRNLAADEIEEKAGPDDLVTVADRAVEAVLSRELTALIPGSRVVGEEGVHADPRGLAVFKSADPVWVIDPIDGTSAFAAGQPQFAVMVALVERGDLRAGWIHAPATGDLVCGQRGEGAWRAGADAVLRRLPRPERPTRIDEMRGITGRRLMSAERLQRIASASRRFRSLETATCAGIDYPRLLSGEVSFALYMKSEPWDHLPGLAMAAEQGLYVAKHDGSPYCPGDNTGGILVAPDRASWDEIRALLVV